MSTSSYFIANPADSNAQILPQKKNNLQEIPWTFKNKGIHERVPFGQVPCTQQSEKVVSFAIPNFANTPTLFQSTNVFSFRLPKAGVNWINDSPVLELLMAVASGTAVTLCPMSHFFTVIEVTDSAGTVLYRYTKETLLLLNLLLCRNDSEILQTQANMFMSDKVIMGGGRSINGGSSAAAIYAGYLPLRGLFEAMSLWYVEEGMLIFNFTTSPSIVSAGTNTNVTVTGGNLRIYTELYAKGNPQATQDAQYFSSTMNTSRIYQLRMLPVDSNRTFTVSSPSTISFGSSIGARRVHGLLIWSVPAGYSLANHLELNLISLGQQGKIIVQSASGDALGYSVATSDDWIRNVDFRSTWGTDLTTANQMKTGKALYSYAFDWDLYNSIVNGGSKGQISLDGRSQLNLVMTPSAAATSETWVFTPTGTATSGAIQIGYKDDYNNTTTAAYNGSIATALNANETFAAEGGSVTITTGTNLAAGAVTVTATSVQRNEFASGRIKNGLPYVMNNTMTDTSGHAVTVAVTVGTYGTGGYYAGGGNVDTYICVIEELYLSQFSSGVAVRAPPVTYDSLTY